MQCSSDSWRSASLLEPGGITPPDCCRAAVAAEATTPGPTTRRLLPRLGLALLVISSMGLARVAECRQVSSGGADGDDEGRHAFAGHNNHLFHHHHHTHDGSGHSHHGAAAVDADHYHRWLLQEEPFAPPPTTDEEGDPTSGPRPADDAPPPPAGDSGSNVLAPEQRRCGTEDLTAVQVAAFEEQTRMCARRPRLPPRVPAATQAAAAPVAPRLLLHTR